MNNNYTVYMHISPSGKKYVGITSGKPKHRWSNGKGYKNNGYFMRAIEKYGWDNFEHIIIAKGLSKDEAEWLEIELIRELDLRNSDKGYNYCKGGKVCKGEWIPTEEQRKKLSERTKGENNPMYNRKGKDNAVSKPIIMIDLDGNKVREFECIREANDYFNKDRAFSYISNRCISKTGGAYGYMWLFKEDYEDMVINNTFKQWAEENSKKVLRVINANDYCKNKKVYQMDSKTLNVIREYNSIQEAKDCTNINTQTIIRNCKHGSNTAGGYSWILKEEYEKLSKEELRFLYCNKTTTEEVRKKMNESRKGKYLGKNNKNSKTIICLTTNKIFECIKEGAEYYNCNASHISACCNNKLKSCGKLEDGTKLVWRYIDIIEL